MNPWFRLASDTAFMIWDAQQVVALRFMRLAAGGAGASREVETSITEKLGAMAEAQTTSLEGIREGNSAPVIGQKVVRVYRKRVKANKKRLEKR